jgi:hypothetical protein
VHLAPLADRGLAHVGTLLAIRAVAPGAEAHLRAEPGQGGGVHDVVTVAGEGLGAVARHADPTSVAGWDAPPDAEVVEATVLPMTDPLAWLTDLEGVSSAYAATRDGIDVMLRDRGLRRTSPDLTAESLLRGAHASAVLEGSASTLEDVRAGEADDIAADAVRLSASMLALAPLLKTAPLQAIARLHTVVASSSLSPEELGRPRDAASADRLRGVSELLLSGTEAPALLVAAVAHADVATAAPFASHNGIVARALERLVLVSRGVDAKSLVVPEAGHLAQRAAYESNLRAYADGGPRGVHAWALYGAEAFAAGAEASPLRR